MARSKTYLTGIQKEQYKEGLLEAVQDQDFIKRTQESIQEFEVADRETEEMIPKW